MPTSPDSHSILTLQPDEVEIISLLAAIENEPLRLEIAKLVGKLAGERHVLHESLVRLHTGLINTVPDITLNISNLKFELNAVRMERDRYKELLDNHGISTD